MHMDDNAANLRSCGNTISQGYDEVKGVAELDRKCTAERSLPQSIRRLVRGINRGKGTDARRRPLSVASWMPTTDRWLSLPHHGTETRWRLGYSKTWSTP
jgi:hypothetical protein